MQKEGPTRAETQRSEKSRREYQDDSGSSTEAGASAAEDTKSRRRVKNQHKGSSSDHRPVKHRNRNHGGSREARNRLDDSSSSEGTGSSQDSTSDSGSEGSPNSGSTSERSSHKYRSRGPRRTGKKPKKSRANRHRHTSWHRDRKRDR
ncbi:hypothetical protein ACA910_000689 [Epithemia clementina (nom. ined.)]